MTEPLDFSNMGRKAATPPPPANQRKAKGFDPWWKSTKVLVALVVAVVVIGAVVIVRSRGGTSAQTKAANQANYCQLSRQFDQLASSTGAASVSGAFEGPPAAMTEFVNQARPVVSQMKSLAASDVRDDLDAVMSGLAKAGKGDAAAVSSPSFAAARQGLQVAQGNCSASSDNGGS
jgi:hypothetical protein